MLFCAGVATGILYWGTIEWAHYYIGPPFGVEPRSAEAVEWAATYGMFHWGPTGWAFYCLATLAIGHAYYVQRQPHMRVSSACHAVLGRRTDGVVGRLLDTLFIVGVLGAAGTSLGFGTPMIAAGVGRLFGVESSFGLQVGVVGLCAALFSASVYLGLKRGIQRLSHVNMVLTKTLLLFVLLAGPTLFILKMATNSMGLLVSQFLRMNTWTDPLTESRFIRTGPSSTGPGGWPSARSWVSSWRGSRRAARYGRSCSARWGGEVWAAPSTTAFWGIMPFISS